MKTRSSKQANTGSAHSDAMVDSSYKALGAKSRLFKNESGSTQHAPFKTDKALKTCEASPKSNNARAMKKFGS